MIVYYFDMELNTTFTTILLPERLNPFQGTEKSTKDWHRKYSNLLPKCSNANKAGYYNSVMAPPSLRAYPSRYRNVKGMFNH